MPVMRKVVTSFRLVCGMKCLRQCTTHKRLPRWGVHEHATVIMGSHSIAKGSKRLLCLLALGGAPFCTYAVVQLGRYSGSGKWPTAVATVEKIEVRRIQDSDSHHFRPVVLFSFVVSEDYYSGEWVGRLSQPSTKQGISCSGTRPSAPNYPSNITRTTPS
jgi:hypothetical protein